VLTILLLALLIDGTVSRRRRTSQYSEAVATDRSWTGGATNRVKETGN
jgi:hypothetical protein